MRRAVQRFKYHGEYQRGYDLGERLAQFVPSILPVQRIEIVTPVPLHSGRYRSRGFNQSRILADCIGSALDLPVLDSVVRIRNTTPQVQLRAEQRLSNLDQAFAINQRERSAIKDATVLVVDDVTTTGATIAAVAGTLQEGGCRVVYGLTLAREQ
jgi:competence protein ComFC